MLVNGKRVNIPSFQVRDNDTIEVKEKSKQLAVVLDATQSTERDVPEYLEVDHRAMKGRFAAVAKAVRRAVSRCRWSRIWWSSSTRAEQPRAEKRARKRKRNTPSP